MSAYYNEFDPFAAQWLRNLIKAGLIAPGDVDERSIVDVTAEDLKGYKQVHMFAGIGGWSLALRLAGVSDTFECWTGSPPCQPFSIAGKKLAQLDERHLSPVFLRLICECCPPVLFGEQVAAAISENWLDDLFLELESKNYACGAIVLPACSVGAPHKRDRLYFAAYLLADSNSKGLQRHFKKNGDTETKGREEPRQHNGARCMAGAQSGNGAENNGSWADADWLRCRDGKLRAVESHTFPLADGVPARVGRLRGYGNAIVPQLAAEFIKAFMESIPDDK